MVRIPKYLYCPEIIVLSGRISRQPILIAQREKELVIWFFMWNPIPTTKGFFPFPIHGKGDCEAIGKGLAVYGACLAYERFAVPLQRGLNNVNARVS
jgi:hypothetical protein